MIILDMKPLQIIERHHDGRVLDWILYDEEHLREVTTDARTRGDYEGELDDLDEYLDWLRSDLADLEFFEVEQESDGV